MYALQSFGDGGLVRHLCAFYEIRGGYCSIRDNPDVSVSGQRCLAAFMNVAMGLKEVTPE